MKKVLFVCLGNICRSPLAEGLFLKKLEENDLTDKFSVDSCGTGAWHIGERPDPRTLENAKKNGVYLPSLARQLNENDLEEFDYILVMDRSNMSNVLEIALPNQVSKVRLMRDFDSQAPGSDVPDPYFGGLNGFQDVFEILDRSTGAFLDSVRG